MTHHVGLRLAEPLVQRVCELLALEPATEATLVLEPDTESIAIVGSQQERRQRAVKNRSVAINVGHLRAQSLQLQQYRALPLNFPNKRKSLQALVAHGQ